MRDLRQYARQTTVRLIAGVLILLFTVGIGLIYLFYGEAAALTGILCLGTGLLPVGLIALVLWIMDRMVKRGRID